MEAQGYTVFRLYQPAFSKQGPIDLIAICFRRIRFIQVRTNSWHDLKSTKEVARLLGSDPIKTTVEAWMYRDRKPEPKERIL